MSKIEIGNTYTGVVKSIRPFGVFVECIEGEEGLVHISELDNFRIDRIEDICNVGDEMTVKCIGADDRGKVRLSRKAVICEEKGLPYEPSVLRPRRDFKGRNFNRNAPHRGFGEERGRNGFGSRNRFSFGERRDGTSRSGFGNSWRKGFGGVRRNPGSFEE